MKREFINIVSYEMKTPIQAIMGFTEMLEQHPDKERGDYRGNIKKC